MSEFRPFIDAPLRDVAMHCHGNRKRFLLGLVRFTLVRTAAAFAADQTAAINAKVDPAPVNFGPFSPPSAMLTPSLAIFTLPTSGGVPLFSTTEFRARKHTIRDRDPTGGAVSEAPLLHYTTVWQRLSEYKSRDRVRVLTLWESTGSSVSLQAGKRGDPSLQWTSRLMNRGGSIRGLLDRLFSVSLADAAGSFRKSTRPANAAVAAESLPPPVVAGLK